MKSGSCKAKGRSFQKEIIKLIMSIMPQLKEDDLVSRSSGSNGEDIIMSPKAREVVGDFSFECKHRANGLKLVYDSLEQAKAQNKGTAIAALRNNRKDAIIAMYAKDFFKLLERLQ